MFSQLNFWLVVILALCLLWFGLDLLAGRMRYARIKKRFIEWLNSGPEPAPQPIPDEAHSDDEQDTNVIPVIHQNALEILPSLLDEDDDDEQATTMLHIVRKEDDHDVA